MSPHLVVPSTTFLARQEPVNKAPLDPGLTLYHFDSDFGICFMTKQEHEHVTTMRKQLVSGKTSVCGRRQCVEHKYVKELFD